MLAQAPTKQQHDFTQPLSAKKLAYEPPVLFIFHIHAHTEGGINNLHESSGDGWLS